MKFFNLLQKELRELINRQMVIGMVISIGMLMIIGSVIGDTMDDVITGQQEIQISDNDRTDFTEDIIKALEANGNVELKQVEVDSSLTSSEILNQLNIDNLIIIPKGFTKSILEDNKSAELEIINRMASTSIISNIESSANSEAISVIENTVKEIVMSSEYGMNSDDIAKLESPVYLSKSTVVNENSAEISMESLSGVVMSQGMVVPIVIFIMVVFASQMIVSAISTEKIDKTLETLLSAPVSRISVLGAKMLAAAIVSLLNSIVYMLGFSVYMGGMMSSSVTSVPIDGNLIGEAMSVADAMVTLGLKMSFGDYILLGLQMFMTIMISLSISLILGAMVTDAKSSQNVIAPVMIGAMVPYIVSMFADINTLPTILRLFLYAIPFTHTFNATHNIIFGNMNIFWFGLAYQFVFFIVCMYFALRLFTSDKIFTISLNLGQKRKMKKMQKI